MIWDGGNCGAWIGNEDLIGLFNCCGSELMVKWIWVCFLKEEDQRLQLGLEHENVVDVS